MLELRKFLEPRSRPQSSDGEPPISVSVELWSRFMSSRYVLTTAARSRPDWRGEKFAKLRNSPRLPELGFWDMSAERNISEQVSDIVDGGPFVVPVSGDEEGFDVGKVFFDSGSVEGPLPLGLLEKLRDGLGVIPLPLAIARP